MQLLSSEGNELPDVLFLDLNMPRKNGFECLSEIKLNPVLKQLPVIIFSASFEQDVVNRLHENGAQYFMRKPSEFSQFKKIIQQTITMVSENLPFGVEGDLTQPTKEKFVITVQGNLIG